MNSVQVNATLDAWLKQEDPSKEVHVFDMSGDCGKNVKFFGQYSGLADRSSEPSVLESRLAPMVAPA